MCRGNPGRQWRPHQRVRPIAIKVFGKPRNYDPRTDSILRDRGGQIRREARTARQKPERTPSLSRYRKEPEWRSARGDTGSSSWQSPCAKVIRISAGSGCYSSCGRQPPVRPAPPATSGTSCSATNWLYLAVGFGYFGSIRRTSGGRRVRRAKLCGSRMRKPPANSRKFSIALASFSSTQCESRHACNRAADPWICTDLSSEEGRCCCHAY
jgi:hypothetical protein